ncbi:nuclear transport factor 2 family protein [Chryseobacterium sp. GP-SGM7]|uniref:nuclear transport factor 2 family protein n=1 Tax=Chryseobacterium sp. GP-SGM7 TaxID=3411323 RepID=UPI003B92FB35
MTLEILKTKEDLRNLIDDYAYLGDGKKIPQVMDLFTPDLTYKVYMNGNLVSSVSGREDVEKNFNGHANEVKTYFTLNGQHTVKIDGETAVGISFSQLKMVREVEGKNVLTDYSVKYDDFYVNQNGKWLIKDRIAYFLIIESKAIS